MIDRTHPLSLSKQAAAVDISRGSVYYLPKPVLNRPGFPGGSHS
jgi:putative transposase